MSCVIQNILQNWFVLWELTKRELERKYARSYLGIIWSIVYPLLRMALVVFLFSYVFNKGIDKYPAYYFSAYLIFEFFNAATQTSLTTLKDNRNLLIKSKLNRELFVLSRVLTAFVNFLLGCIPYTVVLLIYRVVPTRKLLIVPLDIFLLLLFSTGVSYLLSIWFVFLKDSRNIYANLIFVLRFFTPMFFSIEWVSKPIQKVIMWNPMYSFVEVARECIVYDRMPGVTFFIRIFVYGIGAYVTGKMVFSAYENRVVEKV